MAPTKPEPLAYCIAQLQSPVAYPKPTPRAVELRETHISWVFLTDDDVYKIKKPLDLGFLDYSNLKKRRLACKAEVRLNSRFAPDAYFGIVPVTWNTKDGYRVNGTGKIMDWAVHMHRLPDGCRADVLLKAGKLSPDDIQSLAVLLSRIHEKVRCDQVTSKFGATSVIRQNIDENFSQTRETLHTYLSPSEAASLECWQLSFLDSRSSILQQRIDQKHIRDGHGDLRLEQIYFLENPKQIKILDCIEFNDRFRYADNACDLAFLSMDLRFHQRNDLAEVLLSRYARESQDFDLYEVIDFYESYRAFVRGKVSSFLESDTGASVACRAQASKLARRYFELAYSLGKPPRAPKFVIAVGGLLASGKSTVADALAERLAIPVIDSDRTRKWMLGVSPEQALRHAPWQGAYAENVSAQVYNECLRRVGAVLRSGRSVILDASFRSRAARAQARKLATDHSAIFLFIECRAPHDICRERLRMREQMKGVSDGRLEIFESFAQNFDPILELPRSEHLIADTSQPLSETLKNVINQISVATSKPSPAAA